MKKYLKIIIPIVLIGLFCFMIYNIISKINHKKEVAEQIKNLPKFEYQNLDESIFSNKNLKENTPTIFLYFNSDCDFCNHEANEIKGNIKKLDKFQLIFVSFEKPELIKAFSEKHELDKYDNITFIHDSKVTFATTFDVKSLPAIIIYDSKNKLIRKLKGQTKVSNILKMLK